MAVRVVSNRTAKELLSRTGPLTATSANISGQEPLLDCVEAAESLRRTEESIVGSMASVKEATQYFDSMAYGLRIT